MTEQKAVSRCCVMIATIMKEYSELGTDDAFEVNALLKDAMEIVSDHLTEENQLKFADWLTKQIA